VTVNVTLVAFRMLMSPEVRLHWPLELVVQEAEPL
jgi:hypothetical protein